MKSHPASRGIPRSAQKSAAQTQATVKAIGHKRAKSKQAAFATPVMASGEPVVASAAIGKKQTVTLQSAFATPVMASGESVMASVAAEKGGAFFNRPAPTPATRKTTGRLLWIGDALVPTGFATVTQGVLGHLHREWDVIVSGVNYDGAPHKLPYQVMPAWQGGDMWGMDRFAHVCAEFAPDAVVINNDWWNVAKFAALAPKGQPIVGYMPVDGGNLDPAAMRPLNKLAAAVWYTDFGHQEAAAAGFKGARQIIPHGIDADVFRPARRAAARKHLGLAVPEGAFIVGNVNRNQPRKRLDVTIQIFAAWIKRHKIRDAYLLLHCAKKDTGWDLERVARHYGVTSRLIITGSDEIRGMQGTRTLRMVYSSLDAQMTTTLGEGWGLTTMEGMACGVPQIVPDAAALSEWAAPAIKVPCSRQLVHPEINTVGALVDEEPFIDGLQSLYENPARRKAMSALGLELIARDEFRWASVARQFESLLAPLTRKSRAGKTKQGTRKELVR